MKIRPSIVALVWIRRLRGILDVIGYKDEPADIVLFVHPDDIFVVFNPALSFWIGGHQKIFAYELCIRRFFAAGTQGVITLFEPVRESSVFQFRF